MALKSTAMLASTPSYPYAVGREPMTPIHGLGFFVVLALLIALSPRLNPPVRTSASLGLVAVTLRIMMSYTAGTAVVDYQSGVWILGWTTSSTVLFMGLTDPMRDFCYVHDTNPLPLADRPLYIRLWNALCLLFNARLVGWNVQVVNVPKPSAGTRKQLIFRRLRLLLCYYLVLDVTRSFMYSNSHLFPSVGSTARFWTTYPKEPAGTLSVLAFAISTYASLHIFYTLCSLVTLLLRIGRVESWPDLCGNWADAYTLRRFWGRVWHQMLRRFITHYNDFLIELLHIKRGTILSSQLQLHVGFLFSALFHSSGDLVISPSVFGRSAVFFLANGLAITLEDAVLGFARRATGLTRNGTPSPSPSIKLLGYAWVILWLRLSLPVYMNWLFEIGVTEPRALPFSVISSCLFPAFHEVSSIGSAPP